MAKELNELYATLDPRAQSFLDWAVEVAEGVSKYPDLLLIWRYWDEDGPEACLVISPSVEGAERILRWAKSAVIASPAKPPYEVKSRTS